MVIAARPRWINGIRHSVDLDDKDGTYPVKSAAASALGVCAEINTTSKLEALTIFYFSYFCLLLGSKISPKKR